MFAIIIGLIVIALVVTLLLKGYYPQAILFMGGVVLLTCTAIFGWGDLLNAKQTTNFIGFDIFKVFSTGFSSRIAGLGLTLMAIGGFSRYMEHVGASAALFSVFEKPLKLIKSPYVLLGASFLVSQIMVIFVPSHAGLALLLMVTLYPILIRSGVSPMSALGVIGCAQFVDVGPGSGNAILAAQTAGVDVSEYFVYYQLPLFVGVVIILTFVHMFVQRWWDKREGWVFDPNNIQTLAGAKTTEQDKKVPKIYAVLPIIPLFLIIFFSKVAGSHIRMDVVTAMVISTIIAIIFELIRLRNFRDVLASFKLFFEGMGKILVSVVSLIVCGEFFAAGLIKSIRLHGHADHCSQRRWLRSGSHGDYRRRSGVALLLHHGSGNAAFFSFAPLLPNVAHVIGVPIIQLIFPLQVILGFGRASSPITGAIVAISGLAGVSPFQVAKRTFIPMLFGTAITYIAYFLFWY